MLSSSSPLVAGHAERGTSITLYADQDCAGLSIGSASAHADGAFAGAAAVDQDAITTLYGTATDGAGNISECSTDPLVYIHDGTAPAVPVLVATTPASPSATVIAPSVSGSERVDASGIVVRIYTSGDASEDGDVGMVVSSVGGGGATSSQASPRPSSFESA